MSSIVDLINQTFSLDNQTRITAEKNIDDIRNQNPAMFICACLQEFANENVPLNTREIAGILVKRTLELASEGADKLWMSIAQDVRSSAKDLVLGSLASKNLGIRNIAANLVGYICGIELPRKEWLDLIPLLAKNTSHENTDIKKAAIQTLGEICEIMKNKKGVLDDMTMDNILMGICLSLRAEEQDTEIKLLALGALHNSLFFVEAQFEKKDVRDFVLSLVFLNCIHQNKQIRIKGYQCLMDICKLHYEKINDYLDSLLGAILEGISHNDKEIAVPAIEVCNIIATEDKERIKGYSESGKNLAYDKQSLQLTYKIHSYVVPPLLQNLLNQNKYEDDDQGEFNIISATADCLTSICEVIGDIFLDNYATPFVGVNIIADSDLQKRAALITFACMVDGPSTEKLMPLIFVAFDQLAHLIFSINMDIQKGTALVFSKIGEFQPNAYVLYSKAEGLLEILTKAIQLKPKVSINILKTWVSIGDVIRRLENCNLKLDPIMETLLNNGFRSDIHSADLNLIDQSFAALMTLTMCAKDTADLQRYAKIYIERFSQAMTLSGDRKRTIQNGLLSSIQTALLKIPCGELEEELAKNVYLLVFQFLNQVQDITAEGIYVLAALCNALGPKFAPYAEDFWKPVELALKRSNEGELFESALEGLVQLADAVPVIFTNYLPTIMEYFYQLLNTAEFDRYLKLKILTSIGYVSLGCGDLILSSYEIMIKIYNLVIEVAVQIPSEGNFEIVDYLENLRDALLESYTHFIHGLEGTQGMTLVQQHLPRFVEFLQQACNQVFNPTVDFLRGALTFLGDIGKFYHASKLVKTPFTYELLNIFKKFCNNNEQNSAIYHYVEDMTAYLASIEDFPLRLKLQIGKG